MEPTTVFLPGEFNGQGHLACCCPWGQKESDMTEGLTHKYTHIYNTYMCVYIYIYIHIYNIINIKITAA